jgi:hypothetical protein
MVALALSKPQVSIDGDHTTTVLSSPIMDMTVDPVSAKLFGMATVTIGMVTRDASRNRSHHWGRDTNHPGTSFTGNPLDVVAAGNTLYAVSPSFPTDLNIINVTTGDHTTTVLSSPVMDMTVAETGASQVVEPATASLFLSSFRG